MMDDLYIPSYYPNINSSDYVYVDSHVSSTPVLVDIDGDGGSEVVFTVSYYFDKKDYTGTCITVFLSKRIYRSSIGC